MNGPKDVAGPPVEIPRGANVKRIPRAASQRGGAVVVVAQFELTALRVKMADEFGIARHFDDIEREAAFGFEFGDFFFENGVGAKFPSPNGAGENAALRRAGRIREAEM